MKVPSQKQTTALKALCCLAIVTATLTGGCSEEESIRRNSTLTEEFTYGFLSEDPLVAMATMNLFQSQVCRGKKDSANVKKLWDNKDALLSKLKNKFNSNLAWERLQALETLIACQAEGINVTVIDRYREEKEPSVLQQIVEIVALNANIPLQREVGARSLRFSDTGVKRAAVNLIWTPYYKSQANGNDKDRKIRLADRLNSTFTAETPIFAARILRYMNELGDTSKAEALVKDAMSSSDTTRLKALKILAMSGYEGAAEVFLSYTEKKEPKKKHRRRGKPKPESLEETRLSKLGEISIGRRPVGELNGLIKSSKVLDRRMAIDILVANSSPEALQKLVSMMNTEPTTGLQHDIVATIFCTSSWNNKQLGELFAAAGVTDKILIFRLLKERGKDAVTEAFKSAMSVNAEEKRFELIQFILSQMLTPENVESLGGMKDQLEKLNKGETRVEVKEELENILEILKLYETKQAPSLAEYKKMSMERKFHMALHLGFLHLLTPEMTRMLQRSDNLFVRMVGQMYGEE